MAHGFLSYDKNIGQSWFEEKLEKELDKQTKNLKGFIRDKFTDLLFNLRTKSPRSPKPYRMSKEDSVPLAKAFEASSVRGALSPGSDAVNASSIHGGSIVNQVRSNSKPLDAEMLAKDAIVNVIPMQADEDGNFFAKHADLAPPEGGGSGTGEIVRVLEEQTEVLSSLVQATDDQTDNQTRIAQNQTQEANKLARKSKIAAETAGFTKDDFSTNIAYEALGAGGRGLMRGRGVGGGGLMGGGLGMMGMGLGGKVAARRMLTNSIMRRGGSRAMRRMGIALGGQFSRGLGKKLGKKLGGKAIGKIAGGALGKSLGKKIPLVGLGLGALFAAQRAMSGDWLGAGLELASGTASIFPGIGTGASVGLDAALMARDMTRMDTGGEMSGFPGNSILSVNGNPLTSFNERGNLNETIKITKDKAGDGLKIGEGILEAQRRKKSIFGKVQAEGMKEYYDKQGGWARMGESFEFNTNIFEGFGKTLKDILGAITLPMGYKPFQFNSNGDSSSSEDSGQYGKKKDGFWSKRHSGEEMQVNADGVFQSKIGGVVTKIGEHKDLGKYVDIVNSEKGVTERIADISEVMPGIEVGASIGPGDPVAKGNNAGIVHYEIRNGGNENPEKYKAKFGHGGTKDPSEFLEGITNVENTSSTVLNNLSEETGAKANGGTTIINNIINEQSNASNNQGSDVALASSSGDMVDKVFGSMIAFRA